MNNTKEQREPFLQYMDALRDRGEKKRLKVIDLLCLGRRDMATDKKLEMERKQIEASEEAAEKVRAKYEKEYSCLREDNETEKAWKNFVKRK